MGIVRSASGSFYGTKEFQYCPTPSSTGWGGQTSNLSIGRVNFNATRSSITYQNNAHVRPLSIATAFLISY
jgi:hypothetical protein